MTDADWLSATPPAGAVRTAGSPSYASAATMVEKGDRFSAAIVVILIFATTALSLYDLCLFLSLLIG